MSSLGANNTTGRDKKRAVYLIGAGGTHACADAVGLEPGILMRDLKEPLRKRVHKLVEAQYEGEKLKLLEALVNEVVDDDTDYERIITFLDQSPSALHRTFAEQLRHIFQDVLRGKLAEVEDEFGRKPVALYEALLDMYQLDDDDFDETLRGILTLNYDEFLETAAEDLLGKKVDLGVSMRNDTAAPDAIRILKLHGSFGWQDEWPIAEMVATPPLWIPPGIQKAKDQYPFNLLWGLAREMLDCDILRIIGCQLGPNDWDLISLLFSTRHVNSRGHRYVVEVIDAPLRANKLAGQFPFLDVRSILELEPIGGLDPIGPRLVSELSGGPERPFNSLSEEEKRDVMKKAGLDKNWFRLWLKQTAEVAYQSLESIDTPSGRFRSFLEEF